MKKSKIAASVSSVLLASSVFANIPFNTLSVEAASNLTNVSIKAPSVSKVVTISKVTKDSIYIGQQRYTFPKSFTGLFNYPTVLKNARIQFTYDSKKVIKEVKFLELNQAGKAAKHIIFNAENVKVGTIRVNADFVTLVNAKVDKLEVTEKARTEFYTTNVTVSTYATIAGSKTDALNKLAINGSIPKVVIGVRVLQLNAYSKTTLSLKAGQKIDNLIASGDVSVTGEKGATIGTINLTNYVKSLNVSVPVTNTIISSNSADIAISGAELTNISLNTGNAKTLVKITSPKMIANLTATAINKGKVVLGTTSTMVENASSKDLFKNQAQLSQVTYINGVSIHPETFIKTQDFGYWADAGAGRPAYNVGFKLDLAKLAYENISSIKVTLVDDNGKTLATRTATGKQIQQLKADDKTYGGLDGQLSTAFTQGDGTSTNAWWTSSAYDFSNPSKAVIEIKDSKHRVYTVVNANPTGIPGGPVVVANPENFVQTQDFGYWEDAGAGRPAYNVGFKVDLNKLPYNLMKEIKISLVDENGNTLATRTATGKQIEQLKSDDDTYGGLDGQLSAAFVQRDEASSNDWWTSSAYDFTTPSKAVIQITDKDNKVYQVVNANPSGIPDPIVASPENFVQPQDFGYWEDAGEGRPAYNVGFKVDLNKLPYNLMKEIKISLVDENGNTLATRTATGKQIEQLKSDDDTYGGLDGQLSAAFVQRDDAGSNDWWTSSAYDFTTPAKAVIQITDKDNKVYQVVNANPTGIPDPIVANPENFLQPQDFGYWGDAGSGRPAYNVGFKVDLDKLPYNMMKEIKVSLVDENGNTVATRTATGNQIQQLKSDDDTYGGLDGQLSAAFVQRDDAGSNDWWTSSAYDFTTPAKAVIQITDKDNKVYQVANANPTGIPDPIVANPENFVQPQDFGYWGDAGNGSPAYNVGFKVDLDKLPYDMMKEIKISLVDAKGNTVATRTATGNQIQQLKSDDNTYGGLDGQLSAAFVQRDEAGSNDWWTSSAYDFTTPAKAVIQITDKDQKVYKVENTNLTGLK